MKTPTTEELQAVIRKLNERACKIVEDHESLPRKLLRHVNVTNDDLDRQVNTDNPCLVLESEPDWYGAPTRYRVEFKRIVSPKLVKDIDELRGEGHAQVLFCDNPVRELLSEESAGLMREVDAILQVNPSLVSRVEARGLTRDAMCSALKNGTRTMRREANVLVLHACTATDLMRWTHADAGELADLLLRLGLPALAQRLLFGLRVVVSTEPGIKEGSLYLFPDRPHLGTFAVLETPTVYLERKAFMLEGFTYEMPGFTLANKRGIHRVDLVPPRKWWQLWKKRS
jgi:hypothetical protein